VKIYRIGMYANPNVERLAAMKTAPFAHFSAVGTWAYRREPCQVCTYYWQTKVPPLLVQWEPSSAEIGDFSWDGPFGLSFIVKNRVAKALKALRFECRFLPVEYVKPKRRRYVVQFPYEGPKLLWGQCSAVVELDKKPSRVKQLSSCPACGDVRHTILLKGITISRRMWNGEKMFTIATNGPEMMFVTEEGRRMIEKAGFSNIAFSEAGQILDPPRPRSILPGVPS
jgi:hypothetical protein